MIRISNDTETTGIDRYHGAAPYLVGFCDEQWNNTWYEWDVDPLTRRVIVPPQDVEQIVATIEEADELVYQNPKFDVAMLTPLLPKGFVFPWHKVKDTLIAGHLLASNHPHDLSSMAIEYLGINIDKYEKSMRVAVDACRRLVKAKGSPIGDWRIARAGLAEMPSAKESVWKYDCWLPRAVVKWCIANKRLDLLPDCPADPEEHPWMYVTSEYANTDTATTLGVYIRQIKKIIERSLLAIYEERLRLPRIFHGMEDVGVTVNMDRTEAILKDFKEEAAAAESVCKNIAASLGHALELPKGGVNKSLSTFIFEVLKLPPLEYSDKTGAPSLNKTVLEHYENTLPPRSKGGTFIRTLRGKRKRDTVISYGESYQRFWVPMRDYPGWAALHPHLNQTGTDTLRASSQYPNEQNVSKGDQEEFGMRGCFGPAPGREWWSLDASNIELRLPAYEAGEPDMIALFEQPDEPPYYGRVHTLNFHTVYPDIWEQALALVGFDKVGPFVKKEYKNSWYQWCKNGGFAVQYGSVEESGTADRAFHREGCFNLLKQRFSRIHGPGGLNQKMIAHAERYGYVETIPDRSVDPNRGYPLLCTRSEYGRIVPTVPLNYHIQGSAMWWMGRAMVRCQEQLDEWRRSEGFTGVMILQVHDELVFDFPRGRGARPWLTNLPRVRIIASLMRQGGIDMGVPTPVGCEYHATSWGEGQTIALAA